MADEKVDILAFGAHPDDVEITAGGTMFKLKKMGYRTGIVDMTRGEMGTYGTIEEREKEARDAAAVLRLDVRVNLSMPDGGLENTAEHRRLLGRGWHHHHGCVQRWYRRVPYRLRDRILGRWRRRRRLVGAGNLTTRDRGPDHRVR